MNKNVHSLVFIKPWLKNMYFNGKTVFFLKTMHDILAYYYIYDK